jgi:hypothetical protein
VPFAEQSSPLSRGVLGQETFGFAGVVGAQTFDFFGIEVLEPVEELKMDNGPEHRLCERL